jgi:hypothetical protein
MPADRKPMISERNPPLRVFDILMGEDVLNFASDGTARMMLGPEVSKIEFIRSLGPVTEGAYEVDQREIFLRLSMPTSALVEMCAIALEQFGKNLEAIRAGSAGNSDVVKEALKRVAAIKL